MRIHTGKKEEQKEIKHLKQLQIHRWNKNSLKCKHRHPAVTNTNKGVLMPLYVTEKFNRSCHIGSSQHFFCQAAKHRDNYPILWRCRPNLTALNGPQFCPCSVSWKHGHKVHDVLLRKTKKTVVLCLHQRLWSKNNVDWAFLGTC